MTGNDRAYGLLPFWVGHADRSFGAAQDGRP